MADPKKKRRDRYDVSGNIEAQYVDADQTILRNRQGITDLAGLQAAEEVALTCDLLRHIHAAIFGDLYDWAGKWRTVWISKPGTTWPAPDFLDGNMEEYERATLRKYPADAIRDDEHFCAVAAEIQGEFLVIHPFREGNARTIKLATDLLAAQTGRPLLAYDQSEEAATEYIEAAKAAFKREYGPLADIIRRSLAQAQQRP